MGAFYFSTLTAWSIAVPAAFNNPPVLLKAGRLMSSASAGNITMSATTAIGVTATAMTAFVKLVRMFSISYVDKLFISPILHKNIPYKFKEIHGFL